MPLVERGCYLFVNSLFKNIPVLVLSFLLRRLDRKSEACEEKICLLMSSYTYLALRISNPVDTKLSCWCLGINSFGTNWDLPITCTQHGHCRAGAKLSRLYFGIISSRRQISSTYKFYTTLKFLHWRVILDLRRRSYAT